MFRFTQTIIREPSACASSKLQCWYRLHISLLEAIGTVAAFCSALLCVCCTHVQGRTQQIHHIRRKCFYQTTQRHKPEITVPHRHCRQNLKHTLCSEATQYSACWPLQQTDTYSLLWSYTVRCLLTPSANGHTLFALKLHSTVPADPFSKRTHTLCSEAIQYGACWPLQQTDTHSLLWSYTVRCLLTPSANGHTLFALKLYSTVPADPFSKRTSKYFPFHMLPPAPTTQSNPWRLHTVPTSNVNPLDADLNPICPLLAFFGAHHIFHVSR